MKGPNLENIIMHFTVIDITCRYVIADIFDQYHIYFCILSMLNSSGTFFVAKKDPCDAEVTVRSVQNMLNNKYSE